MRLNADECWARLATSERAVLATVHPERGVDAVPVVFALVEGPRLLIPIDTVKPKSTTRLQRLVNLDQDPRCVLLVDEYGKDWSSLWWVRVHGEARLDDGASTEPLAAKYEAYRQPGAVAAIVVLTPSQVTGWAAAP